MFARPGRGVLLDARGWHHWPGSGWHVAICDEEVEWFTFPHRTSEITLPSTPPIRTPPIRSTHRRSAVAVVLLCLAMLGSLAGPSQAWADGPAVPPPAAGGAAIDNCPKVPG